MAENLDWVDIKSIKRYGDPSTGGGGGGWHPDYTEDDPPDFNNMEVFHPLVVFNTNTSWYVPKDGWYRIVCIGGAGHSSYGSDYRNGSDAFYANGPGGGGTGGIAISHLYLKHGEVYTIFNDGSKTTFGNMTATCGTGCTSRQSWGPEFDDSYPQDSYGGNGGTATGGNYKNINGKKGGDGGRGAYFKYLYGSLNTSCYSSPGKASQDGHIGQPLPDISRGRGGQGGYCEYECPSILSRYHYSYPPNSDVTSRNLVDVTNKRIVFGTSAGYQSPGLFTGCVIIETANSI